MTKKKDYPGGVKLTLKTARAVAMQESGPQRVLKKKKLQCPATSK